MTDRRDCPYLGVSCVTGAALTEEEYVNHMANRHDENSDKETAAHGHDD